MKAFASYHPIVLLTYFLSVLVICMFLTNPIIQLTALLGGLCFSVLFLNKREIKSNAFLYLFLFFLITITNPLFSHGGETVLFYLAKIPITLEALAYGSSIAAAVVSVLIWFNCYSKIMSSDKFLYIFGKATPKLSIVLSAALRFVPLLTRRYREVEKAQKAMGMYSSKSCLDKVKNSLRVFTSTLSWSMENAMETAASMKSRGCGLSSRSSFSVFRFDFSDIVLLSVSLMFVAVTLYGAASGRTDFLYYPRMSGLDFSLTAVLVYVSFAALSFLPFMLEVKESLRWKFYISRI